MIPNIKEFIEVIVADGDDMVPVAAWISQHFKIPMVWKRTFVKDHGKMKQYEGIEDIKKLKGKKVLIISEFKYGKKEK